MYIELVVSEREGEGVGEGEVHRVRGVGGIGRGYDTFAIVASTMCLQQSVPLISTSV